VQERVGKETRQIGGTAAVHQSAQNSGVLFFGLLMSASNRRSPHSSGKQVGAHHGTS
jgi:hypothetical protein